jgi:hypothetical protein
MYTIRLFGNFIIITKNINGEEIKLTLLKSNYKEHAIDELIKEFDKSLEYLKED